MLSHHTNTILDLPNYYALKFTNFKAQLKLYVHYRNTHAYTFIFIYNRIYYRIQLFVTLIILAYNYSTLVPTHVCA